MTRRPRPAATFAPSPRPTLDKGTRIYNGGDIANHSHFGTITEVISDRWGTHYEITPDADSDREAPYIVSSVIISPAYLGHGGTRIVTEAAYLAWREKRIAESNAAIAQAVRS